MNVKLAKIYISPANKKLVAIKFYSFKYCFQFKHKHVKKFTILPQKKIRKKKNIQFIFPQMRACDKYVVPII